MIDLGGIQSQQVRGGGIEGDEIGVGERGRVHHLVKRGVEPGVGVLERQGVEPVHLSKIDRWLRASVGGILPPVRLTGVSAR